MIGRYGKSYVLIFQSYEQELIIVYLHEYCFYNYFNLSYSKLFDISDETQIPFFMMNLILRIEDSKVERRYKPGK